MIYVATRAGSRHEISEDTVLVGQEVINEPSGIYEMPEVGFVCVADGVGGHRGGAVASQYVAMALREADCSPENLREALTAVNEKLIDLAKKTPEAPNMATTLTGVWRNGTIYRLIHIGNTRAFVRQGRYLKQITSDHTTYNWLKSSGQLEAAENCNRNEITNCFGGTDSNLLSKLVVSELAPFSLLIMTSDGIHNYVELDTLEDILNGEGDYLTKCETMIEAAVNNGSKDDMTVVIAIPSGEYGGNEAHSGESARPNSAPATESRFFYA